MKIVKKLSIFIICFLVLFLSSCENRRKFEETVLKIIDFYQTEYNKKVYATEYNYENDLLIKYIGQDTNIIIPSFIKKIGNSAFFNNNSIKSIQIPVSVKSMEESAFRGVNNLESIYYEGTLEDWCQIEFVNYDSNPMYNAEHFYMLDTNNEWYEVTKLEIPDSIEIIDDYQFFGFDNLVSINIPNSVIEIHKQAFVGCNKLRNIYIPENVISIEDKAFNNTKNGLQIFCQAQTTPNAWSNIWYVRSSNQPKINVLYGIGKNDLIQQGSFKYLVNNKNNTLKIIEYNGQDENIIIEPIIKIGEINYIVDEIVFGLFSECHLLKSITLPFVGSTLSGTKDTYLGYIFGAKDYKENDLILPTTLKEVIITGGAEIDKFAFYECYNLENIEITSSVISINDSAFYGCSSLESIIIPDSVTSIGNAAFSKCSSLINIELPKKITNIGNKAFSSCTSLESITLHKKIENVGNDAFLGCGILEKVYYTGTIKDWCQIEFENYTSNPMDNAKYFYILDENNKYYEVTELVLPSNIASIGNNQFYSFDRVVKVVLPNTVKMIGDYAFSHCHNLKNIIIPDIITNIGSSAFSDCHNLESIIIPNSVTSIGYHAFSYCTSLTNAYYEGSIVDWCDIDFKDESSNPMYYAKHLYMKDSNDEYYDLVNLTELEIPNTITSIGNNQFYGLKNITKVIIPNSITSIGEHAFYNCSSLESIVIPDSVTSIGGHAFYNCSSLESIIIPVGVTSIGHYAFSGCSSLIIYCETLFEPIGWESSWNYSNRPVVFGYTEE